MEKSSNFGSGAFPPASLSPESARLILIKDTLSPDRLAHWILSYWLYFNVAPRVARNKSFSNAKPISTRLTAHGFAGVDVSCVCSISVVHDDQMTHLFGKQDYGRPLALAL